jgi:hypothetical protein
MKGQQESVEIYLYYETTLRERLHLLTAVQTMAYEQYGKRDWIDEAQLIEEVNRQYLDHVIEIPVFEKLLSEDEAIQTELANLNQNFQERLAQLGDRPAGEETDVGVLEWTCDMGRCEAEYNKMCAEKKKEWLKSHCPS